MEKRVKNYALDIPVYRTWTKTMLECYALNFDCLKCPTARIISKLESIKACKIKAAAITLLQDGKRPPTDIIEKIRRKIDMNFDLLEELKNECRKEAYIRKTVYPKLVEAGKKTKEEAKRGIYLMSLASACFEKILNGLAPEIQGKLFEIEDFKPQKSPYDWE